MASCKCQHLPGGGGWRVPFKSARRSDADKQLLGRRRRYLVKKPQNWRSQKYSGKHVRAEIEEKTDIMFLGNSVE